MTNVRCLIKYSPDTIDVTSGLKDRVEVWRKATDGSGRFKALLLGSWVNQFDPDDPIQIRFDDIIVFEGYIDRGLPLAEGNVYNQFYALVGRDYGQDLLNKQVNKTGTLGVYTVQYADLIIDDMLYEANSEIIFTPSTDHKYGTVDTIPQIPYTDKGDEFLIEAFRKIFEQIDYDFYVDENKTLHIFPIGSVDSGIVLKCVAGASDNNLLNLQKTEFDSYDIKNYIVARANKIDDGWTEFNYEDYTCAVDNTLSNDTDFVNKGLASIKCAKGTGADCRIILTFPKFNYDYLPFDLLGEDVLKIAYRMTGMTGANGKFLIMLEDDAGNKIVWREDLKEKDLWHLLSVPMGKDVTKNIIGYNDLISTWHTEKTNCWHYESGYSTFSWKIKKITFMNYGTSYYIPTTLWIDGLSLPFIMVSYKQNAESQGLYKVRHYTIQAKNVRTQKELDTLATSELAKLMSPLYSLRVTALGSAGIIGGAFKWIPGYMVTVNSPEDGISNQQYRISEAHYVVSEVGQSGHDFIVEADLVPKELSISGSRLSGVQDPKVALLRGLSDRIAALEGIESIYTDYLPPLPRDAAEKINVGDFGNLSDTAVAFTRQWEAEDAEANAIWAVVDDAAAHGGKARAASDAGSGEKIKILDRPLGNVGEFYVLMRVKTSHLDAAKMVELKVSNKDNYVIRYFQNAASSISGYNKFDVNNTDTTATIKAAEDGATVAKIAVRIRKYNAGTPIVVVDWTEITITDSTLTEETINVNVPATEFDRIIVDLRAKSGTTTSTTSFISEIISFSIPAATWTFKVWAFQSSLDTNLSCNIQYGSSSRNSRCTNLPIPEVLGNMEIEGTNFPVANKYHAFAMRCEIPQDKQNLEIAVLYWGTTGRTVYCDYVALLPADVPLGYADVTVADAHGVLAALAASHSTVTVISDGHTTETTIASAHSIATVISSTHSTITSIQSAHTNVTVVASAHSTTAVISNTHSTATVVATPHDTTTTIASAHGIVTVIASAHGTSVSIQDAHGTAAEIALGYMPTTQILNYNTTGEYYVDESAWVTLADLTCDTISNGVNLAHVRIHLVTGGSTPAGGNARIIIRVSGTGFSVYEEREFYIILVEDKTNTFTLSFITLKNMSGQNIQVKARTEGGGEWYYINPSHVGVFQCTEHNHAVSVQPAQHPVSTQPADHSVATQPADHSVATQPSGHPVTTQPSGQSVTTQPAGHDVSTQPSGHPVSIQPSGHPVDTQPSEHPVATQPSGHDVATQPSGHSVTTQPSGHAVTDPAHEH